MGLGWLPEHGDEWREADLISYNFESPWVEGSRVEKLRKLLAEIAKERQPAILTRNENGVIAVINLLRIAGLASHFSAVWNMPLREKAGDYLRESGAYQQNEHWKCFQPPIDKMHNHKADVLHHVAEHPEEWFPQLASPSREQHLELLQLRPEGIVLIDDERANFRSSYASQGEPAMVLRYCKVARYDDTYRDCGPLNQMGGIGAHSDEDYEALKTFLREPWEHPYEPRPTGQNLGGSPGEEGELGLQRSNVSEELLKAPRKRSSFWLH